MYIRKIKHFEKEYYDRICRLSEKDLIPEWQNLRRFIISIWVTQDLLKMYEEEVNLNNPKNYEHLVKGHIAILNYKWLKNHNIPNSLQHEYNNILKPLQDRYKIKDLGNNQIIIDWKFITYD